MTNVIGSGSLADAVRKSVMRVSSVDVYCSFRGGDNEDNTKDIMNSLSAGKTSVIHSTLSGNYTKSKSFIYFPVFESEPFANGIFRENNYFSSNRISVNEASEVISWLYGIEATYIDIDNLIFAKNALNAYIGFVANFSSMLKLSAEGNGLDHREIWRVLDSDTRFRTAPTRWGVGAGGGCIESSLKSISDISSNSIFMDIVRSMQFEITQSYVEKINLKLKNREASALFMGGGYKPGHTNEKYSKINNIIERIEKYGDNTLVVNNTDAYIEGSYPVNQLADLERLSG